MNVKMNETGIGHDVTRTMAGFQVQPLRWGDSEGHRVHEP